MRADHAGAEWSVRILKVERDFTVKYLVLIGYVFCEDLCFLAFVMLADILYGQSKWPDNEVIV